jgi:tRNA pseudouridine32 synthase/23S rRNA pseudouridine746 synthase
MASLGHPSLGDELYGNREPEEGQRLLLHATDLSFVHPLTASVLRFHCEAPF